MTEQGNRTLTRVLLAGLLLAMGAGLGLGYARLHPPHAVSVEDDAHAAHDEQPAPAPAPAERKVLYWYDPMKPEQHFDKPGRSPFMDMDLVPRYAEPEAAAHDGGVAIDARITQNLGLRTVDAQLGHLTLGIEAVGEFQYNQRDVATVQARADGFVERVYDRAPGESVARGAPLADMLIPSWAGAQQEFLGVLALGDARLVDAARSRLRLLGMSGTLIAEVEHKRAVQPVVTLRSPLAGVITSLDVRSGMSVSAGSTLAIVNGSDPVWLEVAVPENRAADLVAGAAVRAELAAYPGATFTGQIASILPAADSVTRSVRLRVSFANGDGRLRPGLTARVHVAVLPGEARVLVPSAAVIRGGEQDRVIRVDEGGRYSPVAVQLGREADGQVEILRGLEAGDTVAAAAQFLLDAEASLKGFAPAPAPAMEVPR